MKKIRSVLSRHRLIMNALALVFVLVTLAAPAAADEFELIVEACETGCTAWNAQNGCVYCQKCCTAGDYVNCRQVPNNQCS
ncbi:MAG: hypothetical protein ACXW3C_03350 [Pyrinomonadaceae bacterium]